MPVNAIIAQVSPSMQRSSRSTVILYG
jgi:hypothetical protein